MAPDTIERAIPALKDPALLRMQCYIDGKWTDADDGATRTVDQSRDRPRHRHRARLRRGRDAARDRSRRARVARVARHAREGPLRDRAQVVRPHARARRRPRADPHHRARQAARRSEGGDRDRRRVRRVVRRGRQARLRRRDPDDRQRSPPRRGQAARRRLRGDHAVEFPVLDDHAQGRAGARGRLHRREQARGSDAVTRRWRSRSSRIARAFRPACSTS